MERVYYNIFSEEKTTQMVIYSGFDKMYNFDVANQKMYRYIKKVFPVRRYEN